MTDIYAFGENWAIPAPLRTKLDTVVSDWVAANPQSDPSLPGRVSTLETRTTDNAAAITTKAPTSHTHTTGQVDGLGDALASRQVVFRPEMYGAKGDGVTDDAAALLATLQAANGETVVLRSGAKYLIKSPVETVGVNVKIRTSGAARAVIYHAGADFIPLTFKGTPNVATSTLVESTGVGVPGWKIANTSSVVPGQIMTVVSSALWYHDPRDTARKSELHVVERVEGQYVYTRDPAFDRYQPGGSDGTVTVSFHTPVSVDVENITVRLVKPPASDSAPERVGMRLEHTVGARIAYCQTEFALGAGVSVRHSYRPVIDSCVALDSCGYFTGYGFQVYGCTHAQVLRTHSAGCRRGVDVSGEVIVSRRTRVFMATNTGGGTDSRGNPYGFTVPTQWSNASPCYGFGSHGPADDTIWDSCTSVSMQHHYTLRGRNEIVRNAKMVGRSYLGAIVCSYGSNLLVSGCESTTGGEGGNGQVDTNPAQTSATRMQVPDGFIYLLKTYQGVEGSIRVENNRGYVNKQFIFFEDASIIPNAFTVRGNECVFAFSDTQSQAVIVVGGSTTVDPKYWFMQGNKARAVKGGGVTLPITVGASPALTAW